MSTADYDRSLAAFRDWLETHCEVDDRESDTWARLFGAWKRYAHVRQVMFWSRPFFNRWLRANGFERVRGADVVRVVGLRVLDTARSHAA